MPKPNIFSSFCACSNPRTLQPSIASQNQSNLQICRYKSKGDKRRQKQESDSESEQETDDNFLDTMQDKNMKTLKVGPSVNTALDAIIKAGLGLSRNKIEVLFYESKVRLNGEKVPKKSAHVEEGDEIDVIKGTSINNPDFLTVARIEILSVVPKEESISVKLRRCKSLTVENYKGRDSWQP
ncbi:hypothetical protein NQ317_011627 [Molorchus minor]|uniref:Mitochondrial transcription rescue factor 1 C-terminal domain-containing protein n=1 Tax=Molorchus minor TaxID=1323400 RepID=A0ABQ9ISK4_9CUCU|nr:hypothetical protein NQ317_011627 [Molorchus minor]